MPAGWIAAAGSIAGGLLGGSAAENAAETQANAQLEAARLQAEAAKFKPYNVTTGFGKSIFDTDKGTASYELDPRLAQMRDLLYGGATGLMPSAGTQQFYGDVQQQAQQRAMQALGMDTQAAAADEYGQLQNLLAPQRARDQASLAQNLFKTGRSGLGTSYGTGSGYINPQQYAYIKALEEQNTQMGMTALDRARQRQSTDIQNYFNLAGQAPTALAGLYGGASGLFGKGLALEEYGLKPLELGVNIGGKATTASSNAAQALAGGITGAAGYQAAGQQVWPQTFSSMFNTLGQRPVTGINPTTGQISYGQSPLQSIGSSFNSLWNQPQNSYWQQQNYGVGNAPINDTGADAGYYG